MSDGGDRSPDRLQGDRVDVICNALRSEFAERALTVAQHQMSSAYGSTRVTWSAVVDRLEVQGRHG